MRRHDNVLVEGPRHTVRFEIICLRIYDTVSRARDLISRHLTSEVRGRPRSSRDRRMPDQVPYDGFLNPPAV